MSRITVYDRAGNALAELIATASRAWKLNEYGQAQIELSTREAAVKEETLRYGNLVLIEHETLGEWGGVIDTPRAWSAGSVLVNAYSAEYLLTFRRGPVVKKLNGTAGAIFSAILRTANGAGDLRVSEGEIYQGGQARQIP